MGESSRDVLWRVAERVVHRLFEAKAGSTDAWRVLAAGVRASPEVLDGDVRALDRGLQLISDDVRITPDQLVERLVAEDHAAPLAEAVRSALLGAQEGPTDPLSVRPWRQRHRGQGPG